MPWVVAGSGGALLIGSLVTGVMAKSKATDLEKFCAQDGKVCPQSHKFDADSVRTLAITTDVLWSVGAAAAVRASCCGGRASSIRSARCRGLRSDAARGLFVPGAVLMMRLPKTLWCALSLLASRTFVTGANDRQVVDGLDFDLKMTGMTAHKLTQVDVALVAPRDPSAAPTGENTADDVTIKYDIRARGRILLPPLPANDAPLFGCQYQARAYPRR